MLPTPAASWPLGKVLGVTSATSRRSSVRQRRAIDRGPVRGRIGRRPRPTLGSERFPAGLVVCLHRGRPKGIPQERRERHEMRNDQKQVEHRAAGQATLRAWPARAQVDLGHSAQRERVVVLGDQRSEADRRVEGEGAVVLDVYLQADPPRAVGTMSSGSRPPRSRHSATAAASSASPIPRRRASRATMPASSGAPSKP
jgi:hypothetical protein